MEKNINQLKKRLHRYIIYQRAAGYYDNYKKLKRYQEESKRLSKLALNAKSNKELFYLLLKSPIINSNQKENEILGLLNLVRKMDPKVILEIGTQRGGTLFLFSQVSNLTTKLISIDYQYPSREYRQSLSKLAKRGQKLVSIQADSHSESTLQQVKKLIEQKGIDFLFIDGDHSYEGVKKDFEMYSPLVRSGGLIAFHDINPDSFIRTGVKSSSYVGGVPFFWQEVKIRYPGSLEFIQDECQDGFGIGVLFVP